MNKFMRRLAGTSVPVFFLTGCIDIVSIYPYGCSYSKARIFGETIETDYIECENVEHVVEDTILNKMKEKADGTTEKSYPPTEGEGG